MRQMIVDELVLLDDGQKMAKIVSFASGINVVTSDSEKNGSFVGKSVIMRSIFHVLGGNALFHDDWDKGGSYSYILSFHINENKYRALRTGNFFRFIDATNGKVIQNTMIEKDLGGTISDLAGYTIFILDSVSRSYVKASAPYYFLFSFSDQSTADTFAFNQFSNVGSSFQTYSDVIYGGLGINNKTYFDLISSEKKLDCELRDLNSNKQVITKMLEQLNSMKEHYADLPSIEILKNDLEKEKATLVAAQEKAGNLKKKILEAAGVKAQLEDLLRQIQKGIDERKINENVVLDTHECPYCHNEIKDTASVYFGDSIESEQLYSQKEKTTAQLDKVTSDIDTLSKSYETQLGEISSLEKSVFGDTGNYQDILTKHGFEEILKKLRGQSFDLDDNIGKKKQVKGEIDNELGKFQSSIQAVDKIYLGNLSALKSKYALSGIDIRNLKTAASKTIKIQDNEKLLGKALWHCALLTSQYQVFKDTDRLLFPIVFDDPVNGDFDEEIRETLLKMSFDILPEGGQAIVSAVGFSSDKFPNEKVNVIKLTNPCYHLLNSDDYFKAKAIYNSCFEE